MPPLPFPPSGEDLPRSKAGSSPSTGNNISLELAGTPKEAEKRTKQATNSLIIHQEMSSPLDGDEPNFCAPREKPLPGA